MYASSRIGFPANAEIVLEGYEREIQQQVKVDDETKNLVDSKWSDYEL